MRRDGPPPRIHWVSPLPPQRTDIAHYTRRILPELSALAPVVLWTDAETWDSELETFATVRRFDPDAAVPMDMRFLPRAPCGGDAIFFHIGNSWAFHSGIFRLARRVPGCIVLHDLAIQEFLRDMVLNGLLPRRDYDAEMATWHGADGTSDAARAFAHGPIPTDILEGKPLFEATMRRAVSALCHTTPGFEAVAARGHCPVYELDLPFAVGPEAPAARERGGPLKLAQFGHIGRNRRLEQVLEVLSGLAGELDFRFDIYGRVWDEAYVQQRIDTLGLTERVRIHGFVEEPVLDQGLREAHLVFNLRYPTMGEASGSQLRIWNAAALSVVTDLGWYAALPEQTAIRIPLQGEADALSDLLRRLARNRGFGERIGANGRSVLEARHTPARYAAGIVEIARRYAGDAAAALFVEAGRDLVGRAPAATRPFYRGRLSAHLDDGNA